MNKLEICNEVRNEAQIPGTDLTSLDDLKGINARVSRWVDRAYRKVLSLHDDWKFLHTGELTFTTSPGKRDYSPTYLSITDLDKWDFRFPRYYETAQGVDREKVLHHIRYVDFQQSYNVGKQNSGEPFYIFEYPGDQTLGLHPIPDKEYTVTLARWYTPPDLTASTEPVFKAEFQDVITFLALTYYAAYDDAPEIYVTAKENYIDLLGLMEESELPAVELQYQPVA